MNPDDMLSSASPSRNLAAKYPGSRLDELLRSLRNSGLAPAESTQVSTSNVEAAGLPFQRWYRFKEAFTPTFVAETIAALPEPPRNCADPFGGSGTTALTCQCLGIRPTTIEVNPFLADVIESKLVRFEPARVRNAWLRVLREVRELPAVPLSEQLPPSFVPPGLRGRWIFDADVAARIGAYLHALRSIVDPTLAALFRVMLGSTLISVSNVVISGKGRRYRGQRTKVRPSPTELDLLLDEAFKRLFADICSFRRRPTWDYRLLRGDARKLLSEIEPVDLVLFSPPYPNSFDYTDIYNVELWVLGYLTDAAANRALRNSTLRSHVQIYRSFVTRELHSPTLDAACEALHAPGRLLWSRHLPDMLRAYADDLLTVLAESAKKLTPLGRVIMAVGDSRYDGVRIDVAAIIKEIAPAAALRVVRATPVRSMRSSAQQGGALTLSESLVELALA